MIVTLVNLRKYVDQLSSRFTRAKLHDSSTRRCGLSMCARQVDTPLIVIASIVDSISMLCYSGDRCLF